MAARQHRVTHPILGPATWREIQAEQKRILAAGHRVCSWCHGHVPAGARTRCGKLACTEAIWQAYSWQRCARVRLRADGFKCVVCGNHAHEVDHIVPVSLGGLGDQDNLRSLCLSCHKEATRRLRRQGAAYVAHFFPGPGTVMML